MPVITNLQNLQQESGMLLIMRITQNILKEVAFKNCASFTRCVNDENLDTIMPMYNLTECSDNYSDKSGSLWQFKRDEQNMNNGNPANVNTADPTSFEYKSNFLGQ